MHFFSTVFSLAAATVAVANQVDFFRDSDCTQYLSSQYPGTYERVGVENAKGARWVQGDCAHRMLCDSKNERDNGCIDAQYGECVHYQPGVWAECSNWSQDYSEQDWKA